MGLQSSEKDIPSKRKTGHYTQPLLAGFDPYIHFIFFKVGGQLVGGEPFMGNEIAGRHPQNKLIYQ
jgi:hypothetical protein